LPLVLLHARNDAKAALAEWLDYRRFAFLQIRRSSEGGERVAVADDDRIVARRNDGCRQQRLERSITIRLRRPAARPGLEGCAAEEQHRRLACAAERARKDGADRKLETSNLRTDCARLDASLFGQVPLLAAILERRHRLVVLAEVGRRVAEVDDIAAVAER